MAGARGSRITTGAPVGREAVAPPVTVTLSEILPGERVLEPAPLGRVDEPSAAVLVLPLQSEMRGHR